MTEEIFDVCDAADQVIGQARRSDVHARGLLHRAVHIWVWNSRSELLIHLRSSHKDEYPNCYTSSASGHLEAGEDYETAAHRELWEELHLRGPLTYMTKLPAGAETSNEHSVLYFLYSDDIPDPDPGEITRMESLPPDQIAERMECSPELFTPPFRSLFRWWRRASESASRP